MKKRDIIIVAISIATAIICIALTFWGNYKNDGVLSPDAFYSVLATFIGICATIIVGFQIASFVKIHETERQIKEVQKERKKMLDEKEQFQKEIDFIEKELSNAFIKLSRITTNKLYCIFAQVVAIVSDKIKNNPNVTLTRYQRLHQDIQSVKQEELQSLAKYVCKLRDLDIPKGVEHYTEIMKLHIEIIEILDNAAKTQEK